MQSFIYKAPKLLLRCCPWCWSVCVLLYKTLILFTETGQFYNHLQYSHSYFFKPVLFFFLCEKGVKKNAFQAYLKKTSRAKELTLTDCLSLIPTVSQIHPACLSRDWMCEKPEYSEETQANPGKMCKPYTKSTKIASKSYWMAQKTWNIELYDICVEFCHSTGPYSKKLNEQCQQRIFIFRRTVPLRGIYMFAAVRGSEHYKALYEALSVFLH